MTQRSLAWALVAGCLAILTGIAPARSAGGPSIQYVPLDAPEGISQAVIVEGLALVHTRQLLPLDRDGNLAGSSADEQIRQVLANLQAVLADAGSGMDKLVRVHVYALSTQIVDRFREQLRQRVGPAVRPAITSVLTPLPHRQALVAVDAVAGAPPGASSVTLRRCSAVAGDPHCADAAVLPRGGVAYLSGQPDQGGLTASAVTRSMSTLMRTLTHLNLSPRHVVQVKVFLRPMTSADEVRREVQKFFPGQMAPPMVFVEWLASMPVEIELIAQYPLPGKPAKPVEYFTPPDVRPSNVFSKVALLQTDHAIYLSGIYARQPSRGEPQGLYVFGQLEETLAKVGSDMRHLVKGTYYVSDDDAARWVDRTRPRYFDPTCPPAASKVMVHGVGMPQRTMTIDMIAVKSRRQQ